MTKYYVTLHTRDKILYYSKEEYEFRSSEFDHQLHRIDGPAVEFQPGATLKEQYLSSSEGRYFIDGVWHHKISYQLILSLLKLIPPELRLTDPRWWVREFKD